MDDPSPKPPSNTEYSLREFIRLHFDAIQKQLLALSLAIDLMAQKPVSSVEFERLKLQVAGLAESAQELEQRVVGLEAHNGMVRWIGRQIATLIFILIVVYLIGWLR